MKQGYRCILFLLCSNALILLLGISSSLAQAPQSERIAFVAFKDGQWDIFSISPTGDDLRQITNDPYEDDHPTYSPDGTYLAYASKRAENWDIYLLDLVSGREQQITSHAHYDGAPAWHPNGHGLGFESYRAGDLDIWFIEDVARPVPVNLTATSPAGEFSPAWHDDGTTLFFTSWRAGDNDLWAFNIAAQSVRQLTQASASESHPVWIEAKQALGFMRNQLGDKDAFVLDTVSAVIAQISWLGSFSQATFSDDGEAMVGVYRLYNGSQLIYLSPGNPLPTLLTERAILRDNLSWHSAAINAGLPVTTVVSQDSAALYSEDLTPSSSPHGEPYDLVRLNDLQVGSPWLADTVDDSYQALRQRVRDEVGYDFLGDISEAWRPPDFFSDTSQYSSWHKSGRAFDTRFDWPENRMQIVRENIGGETYWRILLRCEDQTGRCGRPVTTNPWNYSGRARTELAPGQGGIERPNLFGYYVDFTALAEIYGWERIASFDDEDFSWTWHFKAFEYWHFQKVLDNGDGTTNWYQAMRDVYPSFRVDEFFTWDKMRAADEDPYLIAIKGVPLPPVAQRWWQALTSSQ